MPVIQIHWLSTLRERAAIDTYELAGLRTAAEPPAGRAGACGDGRTRGRCRIATDIRIAYRQGPVKAIGADFVRADAHAYTPCGCLASGIPPTTRGRNGCNMHYPIPDTKSDRRNTNTAAAGGINRLNPEYQRLTCLSQPLATNHEPQAAMTKLPIFTCGRRRVLF